METLLNKIVLTTYGVVLASTLGWSASISRTVSAHSETIADIRSTQSFYATTTTRADKQLADIVVRLEKMQRDLYEVKLEVVKQAK